MKDTRNFNFISVPTPHTHKILSCHITEHCNFRVNEEKLDLRDQMDNEANQDNPDRLDQMDNQDLPDREENLVLRDQVDLTVSFH